MRGEFTQPFATHVEALTSFFNETSGWLAVYNRLLIRYPLVAPSAYFISFRQHYVFFPLAFLAGVERRAERAFRTA